MELSMNDKISNLFYELRDNNGFTVNRKFNKPTNLTGYMVSLEGFETQIDMDDLSFFIFYREMCLKMLWLYYKQDKYPYELFLGAWIDNNKLYIDISINLRCIDDAIEIGLDNNQKAIFDLDKQESIYIGVI